MAMKDFQSLQVTPGDEDATVRLWMSFGWELKNKQRVKTADSQRFTGQDNDGTEHYQTTFGVDFFELTFERDPERKNYSTLKSLENEYYSIKDPPYPEEPVLFGKIWLILGFGGLLLYGAGLLIIIWRIVRFAKLKKKFNEDYPVYTKECAEKESQRNGILGKAQALV